MSGNVLTAGKNTGTLIDPSVREKSMRALEDREFSRLSKKYAETFIASAECELALTVTAETPDEDMERIDEMLYEKSRMYIRRFYLKGVAIWLLVSSLFSLAAIVDKMNSSQVIPCLAYLPVVWAVTTLCAVCIGYSEARYALGDVFDWFKTRRELRRLCGERWLPHEAVCAIATAKSER